MTAPDRFVAARNLRADAVSAQAVRALRAVGVRSILLKGPTVAEWIYDPDEVRPYVDSDLLVSPSGFDLASSVLVRLGFEELTHEVDTPERGLAHAVPWLRHRDGAQLDLHRTLTGTGVDPADLWECLIAQTEPIEVAGEVVDALSPPGRAMMLALHARQHGAAAKPVADVLHGLDRLPEAVWRDAAALAERLDATAAMAIGLRRTLEGGALADRLGLPSADFAERVSTPGSHDRVALGIRRLAHTGGASAKLGLVAREVVPSPTFMRWWSPLARRGRFGLAAAYVYRFFWLVRNLGPSIRLWSDTRGSAR
jgi:hypothetical protein